MRTGTDRIHSTLQPVLDILDEGLRLYRRGFTTFVLLTAIWLVPTAIGVGIAIALEQVWLAFLTLLVAIPLAIYLIVGLSRATLAVQQGHSVNLIDVLTISPLRLVGMGCYAIVFMIAANAIVSLFFFFWFCIGFSVISALFGSMAALLSDAGTLGTGMTIALGLLVMLLMVIFYVLSLVVNGAVYSSLVYSLQPFVQHHTAFGDTIQHSINLIAYRFGHNLLAFLITSTIFGAIALAVTTAIVALLPLPLFFALGEESPVAQGVSACAWIIGLIVVLPPLPIWMALLYQRNNTARQGADLNARISTLLASQPQQ